MATASASAKLEAPAQAKPVAAPESHERITLAERRSPELVIGLVGPVGSGVSTSGRILSGILKTEYAYDAFHYKVSDVIVHAAELIGENYDESLKGAARIERLQTIGNNLRSKFGSNYLVEKCVESIAIKRLDGGYRDESHNSPALPKRRVHIIDSLKNPAEAEILRQVYGDVFWLVAVFAPREVREKRLSSIGIKAEEMSGVITRDENEDLNHGQRVRDTSYWADFFIRNDGENTDRLDLSLKRYLRIIFNISVDTPTIDESAMYNAFAAASKSACLSRQVGASIYSSSGELIGIGWNDVPRFKGGLYGHEDDTQDHRCYKWGAKICHNDSRKESLYYDVSVKIRPLLRDGVTDDEVRTKLLGTDIRNLIEYSRSVHAEMEAIISVARDGKFGLNGSTLYCTTFPCHSCARHIIASGIERVVYIEPYPKSLALELHYDAATVNSSEVKKTRFLQYEGVAPKNVIRLFKHGFDRKQNGALIERSKSTATPVFMPALDGFSAHEQIVVNEVKEKEEAVRVSR